MSGARWVVAVGAVIAVIALPACGTDSVDQAHNVPTDAAVATTDDVPDEVLATMAPVVSTVTAPEVTPPPSTAPRPTCSTYYRASVTVPPDDGPILSFATPGSSEASFSDLHLTATYSDDGFESPSLNVRVETLPDRAPVFASLYQFVDPTANLNAFAASGQGFTGLIYVYNPVSGSELQFFCSAG